MNEKSNNVLFELNILMSEVSTLENVEEIRNADK